jgi:hypothetical protein
MSLIMIMTLIRLTDLARAGEFVGERCNLGWLAALP